MNGIEQQVEFNITLEGAKLILNGSTRYELFQLAKRL